jgi:F-type H+-transporting ATPase subunit b
MNKAFLTSLALASLVCFGPTSAHADEPSTEPAEVHAPTDSGALDTLPGFGAVHEPAAGEHAGSAPAGHDEHAHAAEHEAASPTAEHEHGEHGSEHAAFSGKTFALQLVNFGVLLFLLIWFGGRAMNKALRAKHDQLKADIDTATRQRDEAKRAYEAQEQRVAGIEKEVAALRASMRADAEREQAALLAGAQERGRKIQDEMRFQLDQQVKEAEAVLRAEVASASVKLAEELVRQSVSPDDERRLAREFVAGFDEPQGSQRSQGSKEVVR